jgi:hypothetical protein
MVYRLIAFVVDNISIAGPGEGNDGSMPMNVNLYLCGLLHRIIERIVVTVHEDKHLLALDPRKPARNELLLLLR